MLSGVRHNRLVDVRHRVIDEKRPIFVPGDEIDQELVHDVGQVVSGGKVLLFAIDGVIRGLPAPVAAAAGKDEILVEAPFARTKTDLPPLSHAGGHVAGLLQYGGDHGFAAGIDRIAALVADQAGAKGIAAGQQFAARRSAERGGVAVLKPQAAGCQFVDMRRMERPAAAMDVSQNRRHRRG